MRKEARMGRKLDRTHTDPNLAWRKEDGCVNKLGAPRAV